MASIINASSTGSGGIVQTADASGVLQLQSNGTVAVNIDTLFNVQIGTTTVANSTTDVLTVGKNSTSYDASIVVRQFGNGTAASLQLISANDTGATYNNITSTTAGGTQHWKLGGTSGAAGALPIFTSGVERMRISSAGYVTQPYQPGFMAYVSNSSSTFTAGTTILFDGTNFNTGSNYNGANGRFTAPVTGVYHFCRNQQSYSASNQEVFLYKNGAQVNDTTSVFSVGANGNNSSIYLSLAAGDYVTVYQYSGTSSGDYNNFSGRLVG